MTHQKDQIMQSMETALELGRFIGYKEAFLFSEGLNRPLNTIQELVDNGKAASAVRYYEIFMAGCHRKTQEIDDSSADLSMFLDDLFIRWIKARQKAGFPGEETVGAILKWMENDDTGYCFRWHETAAKVLDKKGFRLLKAHFEKQFNTAYSLLKSKPPCFICECPAEVRSAAGSLKDLYKARKDYRSYLSLCQQFIMSPVDYAETAELMKEKKKYNDALEMVEKALELESKKERAGRSTYSLEHLNVELLKLAGRKQEAFDMLWQEFKNNPAFIGYEDIMECVPIKERDKLHAKAMEIAEKKAGFEDFMEICANTKEWGRLAGRVLDAADYSLASVFYSKALPAAKGLSKKHPVASIRLFKALAIQILNAGKSRAYKYALDYLKNIRDLYKKIGDRAAWDAVVEDIRARHGKKYGFMPMFETLVAGGDLPREKSFEEIAEETWARQAGGVK